MKRRRGREPNRPREPRARGREARRRRGPAGRPKPLHGGDAGAGSSAGGSAPGALGIVVAGRRGLEILPYPAARGARAIARPATGSAGDLVRFGARRGSARAPEAEPVGRAGDGALDVEAVQRAFGLRGAFPEACLAEADGLAPGAGAARLRREDLRPLPLVTIDPEAARDHDDAVAALREGEGFRLWVAIADVASCVAAGGAIDHEARLRGNSVYFPDCALPMLPPRLSAELCSLRPGEERAALAVELHVAPDGAVRDARLFAARIRSHARLGYAEAAALVGGAETAAPAAIRESLGALADAAGRLRAWRARRGALVGLDVPEAEGRLAADGRPLAVRASQPHPSHAWVEEAMLAANQAVARILGAAGHPLVHRVHEAPDAEALAPVARALRSLGRPRRRVSAAQLAALLAEGEPSPARRCLHQLAVRCLPRAHYAAEPLGHFALASDAYVHFTSPIRRYADLMVQRAAHRYLLGRPPEPVRGLAGLAAHLSRQERKAAAAERLRIDLMRAVLLADRIGERFAGTLTGIREEGLSVGLADPFGEGRIPPGLLPPRTRVDPAAFGVTLGGRRLRLGDALGVRLAAVDLARGRIVLAPAQLEASAASSDSSSAARRSHSR